jgi:uncharacterized protein
MVLPRTLAAILADRRQRYPVVAINGPRQVGKSTLARLAAPDLPLVHLEDPIEAALITADWRGFFARHPHGAILDEAQKVPALFSALHADVDRDRRPGRWLLTGSQPFAVQRGIAQSLAGRVALLSLWPLAHEEQARSWRRPSSLSEAVFTGGLAPLHDSDRRHDPVEWLSNYVATMVERDIIDLIGVRNRAIFGRFMAMCAASTGTEITKQRFADGLGIDGKTVEAWLSALEAVRIIVRLSPHTRKFGKRLVSKQKLYFTDTGLACRLLHLRDVAQVRACHEWGQLFETWVIGELIKAREHRGLTRDLWFWRTSDGHEVDAILDSGTWLLPIEIKASQTPDFSQAAGLRLLRELNRRDQSTQVLPGLVIYGGDAAMPLGDDRVVPWDRIAEQPELLR